MHPQAKESAEIARQMMKPLEGFFRATDAELVEQFLRVAFIAGYNKAKNETP